MGLFNKKELQEIAELKKKNAALENALESIGGKDFIQVREEKQRQLLLIKQMKELLVKGQQELNKIESDIAKKRLELEQADVDIEMADFGLYVPKYDCMSSDEYAAKIKDNRNAQKDMIKNKTALFYYDQWVLDGSRSKGSAMNNDNMKMYLRAFNNECDVLIST